jgi:hypothetical protein
MGATTVPPIASGPYPVGSTNFAVSSLSTADMELRLIGSYTSSADIYISDILQTPSACISFDLDLPANASLFGRHSGKRVHYVAYVLYPTTDGNTRADYVFPYTNTGDRTFPHMQRRGDAPIFRDPGVRYPLIVYTHGQNCHGLWDLAHLKLLASHGFIVAAIQHGDGRNYFQGYFGERPLAVTGLLDRLLADPNFGPAIDTSRIGISGSSLGGCTTLAIIGGGGYGSPLVPPDGRFRAGFGIVPYPGGTYGATPFGSGYSALSGVTDPFFAVYAGSDTTVPRALIEAALPMMHGTRTGVVLNGQAHILGDVASREAFTYELYFFNAWLRDDMEAMSTLYGGMTVAGGVDDVRTYQVVVPPETIDEDACYGNCPDSLRLRVSISGSKVRAVFPASTDGSILYDLTGSPDLGVWQCMRTSGPTSAHGFELPADVLPSGFQWRVVELVSPTLDKPLFLRVRLSRD